eukprot:g1045.t1
MPLSKKKRARLAKEKKKLEKKEASQENEVMKAKTREYFSDMPESVKKWTHDVVRQYYADEISSEQIEYFEKHFVHPSVYFHLMHADSGDDFEHEIMSLRYKRMKSGNPHKDDMESSHVLKKEEKDMLKVVMMKESFSERFERQRRDAKKKSPSALIYEYL